MCQPWTLWQVKWKSKCVKNRLLTKKLLKHLRSAERFLQLKKFAYLDFCNRFPIKWCYEISWRPLKWFSYRGQMDNASFMVPMMTLLTQLFVCTLSGLYLEVSIAHISSSQAASLRIWKKSASQQKTARAQLGGTYFLKKE